MPLNTIKQRSCFENMSYDGAATLKNASIGITNNNFDHSGRFSATQIQSLDLAFKETFKTFATATIDTALLRLDGAEYQRTQPSSQKVTKLHYWASVGKMMTALGIMVLQENGRLTLDDPISKYVSGVPEGKLITIKMLLNHTSGLYSANEDPQIRTSNKLLSLPDEIAILNKHGNLFCPGTNWRYSNSGYTLLAEIIRKVSGQSYSDFVMTYVIAKSSAWHIRLMTAGERPENVAALVLNNGKKVTVVNHFGGAGSVIADAKSMAQFFADVLQGRIVSKETLHRMTRHPYPMFQSNSRYYGLGMMVYKAGKRDHQTGYLLGHTGGLEGASAFVGWSPKHQAIVAVALTGKGSAEYSANKLFKALESR